MSLANLLAVLMAVALLGHAEGTKARNLGNDGFVHVPAPELRFAEDRANGRENALRESETSDVEAIRITLPNGVIVETELEINLWLLADSYKELAVEADGSMRTIEDAAPQRDCYFLSKREASSSSSNNAVVAISTCSGVLTGSILTNDGQRFELEHKLGSYSARARKLGDLYGSFDMDQVLQQPAPTYINVSTDDGIFTKSASTSAASTSNANARTTEVGTSISGDEELYIEILIVSDLERVSSFANETDLTAANLRIMNQVAAYYSSADWSGVNINIGLSGQILLTTDVFGVDADTNGETNVTELLSAFNEYRWSNLDSLPSHDTMHLLSGTDFTDSVVGLAYLGSVCDEETLCSRVDDSECLSATGGCCSVLAVNGCCIRRAAAISQMIVGYELLGAETVAHETGHQLGFVHDGTSGADNCATSGSVMASVVDASADLASQTFSSCSIATFVETFETSEETSGYHPYECLTNVPSSVLSGNETINPSSSPKAFSTVSAGSFAVSLVSMLWLRAV
ncbi:Zinc metalloproteinase/disintegrin [Hondaea fermentalgiana]|uniref:Zinc metalloproteinase/disintegrin n=1 Tax=Hondaea fermentalgiana TaxID=2315210 RepID=A0A2R5G8F6_9STRA|nr:Zinc metalloproteinase/disintegrin [Hondaea fermentalgiana]|eukprot:GBG27346.1 Zinc metalloproteinase/disintegrin [Hondaea fermentalgiana]